MSWSASEAKLPGKAVTTRRGPRWKCSCNVANHGPDQQAHMGACAATRREDEMNRLPKSHMEQCHEQVWSLEQTADDRCGGPIESDVGKVCTGLGFYAADRLLSS